MAASNCHRAFDLFSGALLRVMRINRDIDNHAVDGIFAVGEIHRAQLKPQLVKLVSLGLYVD